MCGYKVFCLGYAKNDEKDYDPEYEIINYEFVRHEKPVTLKVAYKTARHLVRMLSSKNYYVHALYAEAEIKDHNGTTIMEMKCEHDNRIVQVEEFDILPEEFIYDYDEESDCNY